ncbi:MAG: hydantoinase/oxoprolinase family protein, partial [Chloroflexota bacterium]
MISAYLQPIVESYVDRLAGRVKELYPRADLRIIQCNGGTMRAAAAKGRAVNLVNSGPAGGATAASFLARLSNEPKVCAVDMGGTSFDVSVIADGSAHVTTEGSFEGYPMRVAMSEVTAIGAGGGSIARVDRGGALEVGPQSAAAVPGPACYDRGGTMPTVTDANVVLGRISPDYFLGGEIRLRKDLAEQAIARHVAEPLGLPLAEAAHGVLRVVNAKMAKEMVASTIQRGHDPREFALLAFGGAGPLHAVDLAEELAMRRVIVPRFPGVFSAFGLLVADTRHDFLRTVMRGEDRLDPGWLTGVLRELTAQGEAELAADGIAPAQRRILWSADLRFEGQSYEMNVPIERKDALEVGDVTRLLADFAALHERVYAFRAVDEK